MQPVLEIRGLTTVVRAGRTRTTIVDDVGLEVAKGATLGIVGESGSGKSVTMLSVMGLLPRQLEVTSGEALLLGRDLLRLPMSAIRRVRGREVAMVFQDPMTSLNPVMTVGRQIAEAVSVHDNGRDRGWYRERAVELLEIVGVPNAAGRIDSYPHEFSGGMRQRVMIAMAMSNDPKLLIADEPTTALDVTVQAQVLDAFRRIRERTGAATIFVTHDLGIVAEWVDRVIVMYAGRIVESAEVDPLFHDPRHPYSLGLVASLPKLGEGTRRLIPIPGQPPDLTRLPPGCAFQPRCPIGGEDARCIAEVPPLVAVSGSHHAACFRSHDVARLKEATSAGAASGAETSGTENSGSDR
jgi:oligopeptide/dipeptide ABC transporter ATP-binding protein